MKVTILDTSFSQTNQPTLLRIDDFAFKKEFYKKSKYQMKRQEYDSYVINSKGIFLTGLIPKILKYCNDNNIEIEVITNPKTLPSIIPQNISPLFTLREDQKTCVQGRNPFLNQVFSVLKNKIDENNRKDEVAIPS